MSTLTNLDVEKYNIKYMLSVFAGKRLTNLGKFVNYTSITHLIQIISPARIPNVKAMAPLSVTKLNNGPHSGIRAVSLFEQSIRNSEYELTMST